MLNYNHCSVKYQENQLFYRRDKDERIQWAQSGHKEHNFISVGPLRIPWTRTTPGRIL